MKWYDSSMIRYVIPAAMFTGWTILMWIQQSIIPSLEVVMGLALLLMLILIFTNSRRSTTVLWNAPYGVLAILYNWTVEVISIRQLGSVPMGIDLTHSAERVLEAMSTHYEPNERAFVRFFISRPLNSDTTRVGFSVHRKNLRILNGVAKATKMSESLAVDVEVLESAMRAAYPHVAVIPASDNETRMITSGGVVVAT